MCKETRTLLEEKEKKKKSQKKLVLFHKEKVNQLDVI